ncbi:UNVERIFIED_CONTAM: hypothetical protein K2H54_057811 [Gekko kuhli]
MGKIANGASNHPYENYQAPFVCEANIHSQWEDFSDSVRDTMAKYPEALTILAGDLNARIGGRDDELIPLTLGAPDLVLPPPWYARISKDLKINTVGKHLAHLAITLNLLFLNGTINPE